MRGFRNSCHRASNFDNVFSFFFLVDERGDNQNTTKSGPSSARQRNAIQMVFRWRADDGPTLNSGMVALWILRGSGQVLLKKTLIFVIFFFLGGGRGPDHLSPPRDPSMLLLLLLIWSLEVANGFGKWTVKWLKRMWPGTTTITYHCQTTIQQSGIRTKYKV